jgi:hypothetical protein
MLVLGLGSAAPGVQMNLVSNLPSGTEEAGVKQNVVRVSRIDVGLLSTTITRKL